MQTNTNTLKREAREAWDMLATPGAYDQIAVDHAFAAIALWPPRDMVDIANGLAILFALPHDIQTQSLWRRTIKYLAARMVLLTIPAKQRSPSAAELVKTKRWRGDVD
jgi:hypothetical protein